jgi:hypothetical protein
MKYFRLVTALCLSALTCASASAFAQSSATPTVVPPPTASVIPTAPFMVLRLNLTTLSVASVGDVLAPGKALAAYNAAPRAGARILAATPARSGTFPASIPVGTTLFQVGLGDVDGYCAPLASDQGVRRSQCFIDVNADNKFDASYISIKAQQGQKLFSSQLASLAAIPPVAYEIGDVSGYQPEPVTFYFRRIRAQMAEFQLTFDGRPTGADAIKCALDGTSICRVGQHNFTLQGVGGSVKILSQSLASTEVAATQAPAN